MELHRHAKDREIGGGIVEGVLRGKTLPGAAKQFAVARLVHRLDPDQLVRKLLGMADTDILLEVLPRARRPRNRPAFKLCEFRLAFFEAGASSRRRAARLPAPPAFLRV